MRTSALKAYWAALALAVAIFGHSMPGYAIDFVECARALTLDDKLGLLQQSAQELAPILKDSRVIVYPASGFDLMTPFALAPNAMTVIGIDNHAFRNSKRYGQIAPNHIQPWATYMEVDRVASIEEALIQSLKTWRPDAKTISSTEFIMGSASNGLIEFDLNDGKGIRRYFHVNGQMPLGNEPIPENIRFHLKLQPDTLFVKAAMNVLGAIQTIIQEETGSFRIAKSIIARGGIIADSDGNDWHDVIVATKVLTTSQRVGYAHIKAYSFAKTSTPTRHEANKRNR